MDRAILALLEHAEEGPEARAMVSRMLKARNAAPVPPGVREVAQAIGELLAVAIYTSDPKRRKRLQNLLDAVAKEARSLREERAA